MELIKRHGISIIALVAAIIAIVMGGKSSNHPYGFVDGQSSSVNPSIVNFQAPAGVRCRIHVVDQSTGAAVGGVGTQTPGIVQSGVAYTIPKASQYRMFPQFLDPESNTWRYFELKDPAPGNSVFVGSYSDGNGAPHGISITVQVQ